MRAIVPRVAVFLAVVFASGCGETAPPAPSPVMHVITGPDGSVPSPYDIAVADGLVVELRGNGGTPYWWYAVAIPPIVAQRGPETIACIGEGIPGCAQLWAFEFDVVAPGEGTLRFEYASGETGVPPAQTFEITLRVY